MIITAEFQDSIAPAIPDLVNLLQDNDRDVRRGVAAALLQFSEQGALIHPFF